MTKFEDKAFSVGVGGQAYADNWERIFGKKKKESEPEPEEVEVPDILKSLSEEEYAALEPLSEEKIKAALDQGREEMMRHARRISRA